MAQPLRYDYSSQVTSEGVPRARTATRFGIPTGTLDERKTAREQEEEERRGISVPGFFGSVLRGWEAIDRPISERLGIRIPEMRGPLDEIGNLVLQEATRPSSALIALGGVGLAGKAAAGAASLGTRAAGQSLARQVIPRAGQAVLKAGQFAATPYLGARGIAAPVRFGAEAAQVAGFRAASEKLSESIPEDAPMLFRLAAPVAVGIGGGLAGARAFTGAARALNINVANEAGMRAYGAARNRMNRKLERSRDKVAQQEQERIAQLAYGKQWEDLTDSERVLVERNAGDGTRLDEELTEVVNNRRLNRQISEEDVVEVTELIKKGSRPRSDLERIGMIRSAEDVRRDAHLDAYTRNKIENQDDLFALSQDIQAGKYRTADGELRNWNDVPDFLEGSENAMLITNNYEAMNNALKGWLARKADEMSYNVNRARVEGQTLLDAFDPDTGRLTEFGKRHIKVSKDGKRYEFSRAAQPWKRVMQNMTDDLDTMLDAEKRAGIGFVETIGEDLVDFGPGRLPDDPYLGDVFERMGATDSHYFPRMLRDEAMRPGLAKSQGKFAKQGYEKGRRYGFEFEEVETIDGTPVKRPVSSFIRLMADNEDAAAKKGRSYLTNPMEVVQMRLQAGANRLSANRFIDEMNRHGQTVTERMMQRPVWNKARRLVHGITRNKTRLQRRIDTLERRVREAERRRGTAGRQMDRVEGRQEVNTRRQRAAAANSGRRLLPFLNQLLEDMDQAGINRARSGWHAPKRDKERYKELKSATTKLRSAVENNSIAPQKLERLVDEADFAFERANMSMDSWVRNASFRQSDATLMEGMHAIRSDFDQANLSDAQLRRIMNNNAERMTRMEGREDEMLRQLEDLKRTIIDEDASAVTMSRDIDELTADVQRDKDQLRVAQQYFRQAKDQAGDVTEGLGKIADFSSGGRIYKESFAEYMNNFMRDNRDLLPYVKTFNDFARAINATLDLSAIGIQGLLSIGVDPIRAARMIGMTTLALADPQYYNKWVIDHAGQIDDFISHGGYWAGLDDVGEFLFPNKLTTMRGIGKPVKLANHHFSRTGNALRLLMFDRAKNTRGVLRHIYGGPQMEKSLGTEREMVETINNATGFKTGTPTELEQAVLFAPRFFRAQLNLLGKAGLRETADGQMARDVLMRTLTGGALLTWYLNHIQGRETEWNPVSYDAEGNPHYNSDFLRIKSPSGDDVSVFGTYDSLLGLIMTSITEGPTSSAARVFSTKASPAISFLSDAILGETFQGEQVEFMTDDPRILGLSALRLAKGRLPFTLQSTIDLGTTEGVGPGDFAFGTMANLTGIKATRQTPYERRDLRAQEYYDGRSWDELLKSEQIELEKMYPEIRDAIDKQLRDKANQGDLEALARVQKLEIDADRMEDERLLAIAVAEGRIDRRDFSKIYNDLKLKATFEKRGKDVRAVEWATSDDPNKRGLDEYFRIFEDPEVRLVDGDSRYLPINWDVVEDKTAALFKRLGPEVEAYIRDYTAENYEDHPPEIHEFLKAREYISKDTNYWDVKEDAFAELRSTVEAIAGQPIGTYSDLEIFIRQNPNSNEGRSLSGIKKRIDALTRRQRLIMRRRDPELDLALMIAYGYQPATAEARSLWAQRSPVSDTSQ